MLPFASRARLCAAIVTSVALSGGIARADEPSDAPPKERFVLFSISMEESPLDACGGKEALVASVEQRLRRQVFVSGDEADMGITITSELEDEPSWRAQISEVDRAGAELGHRDVPLPRGDCGKALDTLAVVLAIMIGPSRTTTDPPRAHATEPDERPVVRQRVDRPARPRRRPPPPPPPPRWSVAPLLELTAGSGILPRLAWGLEAGAVIGVPVRGLSSIARAAYWPPTETGTRPNADIDRIGGSLLLCYDLVRSETLGVAGCAGGGGGRVQARSEDLTRASESSIIVGVLGELRLGYRRPLGQTLFIEPSLAAQITGLVRRDRFTYRDLAGKELTLLLPAPVAAQGNLGVALHFL